MILHISLNDQIKPANLCSWIIKKSKFKNAYKKNFKISLKKRILTEALLHKLIISDIQWIRQTFHKMSKVLPLVVTYTCEKGPLSYGKSYNVLWNVPQYFMTGGILFNTDTRL